MRGGGETKALTKKLTGCFFARVACTASTSHYKTESFTCCFKVSRGKPSTVYRSQGSDALMLPLAPHSAWSVFARPSSKPSHSAPSKRLRVPWLPSQRPLAAVWWWTFCTQPYDVEDILKFSWRVQPSGSLTAAVQDIMDSFPP